MSLYHLVYISTAYLPDMPEEELSAIVAESLKHNSADDITGMLLYSKGMFMQVLEGSEDAVTKLYERIKKDRRHTGPTVLLSEAIDKRSFAGWYMGFHWIRKDDTDVYAELLPYLEEGCDEQKVIVKTDMALTLLQDFGKINQGRVNDLRPPPH